IFAQAIAPAREDETRSETLHVPLPRGRKSFVEIIYVEDQTSFGRSIDSEVEEVCIATNLRTYSACGCVRQIRSHVERRSAIERKWRLHHSSVPNRNQLRHPSLIRLRDQSK